MVYKKLPDKDPKELFEAVTSWYNTVFDKFRKFRVSSLGKKHRDTLDSFLHEAMRASSTLEFCLANDNLPEHGRSSMKWVDYNKTLTNIGLMELLLEQYILKEEDSNG